MIGTILAIFDLQVTPMLPSKFGVKWPFSSGEEAKTRFSRWLPWRPSWISDRHYFSYFSSISHPNASYQVWSQLAFGFRSRSEKIDFQDGHHGSHLGFPMGMILVIFDLQVTLVLPSKFGVNWPFRSGEEAKNRFSRWLPWRSWISDRHNFSYFWSTRHPMLPSKFGVNWPFGSGEEEKNRFSRWPPWWPSWISDRHNSSYFWSTRHPDAS